MKKLIRGTPRGDKPLDAAAMRRPLPTASKARSASGAKKPAGGGKKARIPAPAAPTESSAPDTYASRPRNMGPGAAWIDVPEEVVEAVLAQGQGGPAPTPSLPPRTHTGPPPKGSH